MRITFYGSLAEAIGREIELDVTAGTTVGAVRARLAAAFPAAAATLAGARTRAAIDDVLANADAAVPEGAELAFFPPVSGG